MNIVCIDTSWKSISITAQGELGVFTSIFTPVRARHSAILIPAIETAVKEAGFSINETEVIVCPQGPGGFTGLRLAYSTAKAIQLKTNAEFYCIPVLEAICSKYAGKGQFLSIIDAKRDCFYVQLFEDKIPSSQALDISAEKTIQLINKNKNTLICGFGTDKFKESIIQLIEEDKFTFIEIDPEIISKLMLDCFISGKNHIKVEDWDGPVYVRKSDAEH